MKVEPLEYKYQALEVFSVLTGVTEMYYFHWDYKLLNIPHSQIAALFD